jgi:hypothetical protein
MNSQSLAAKIAQLSGEISEINKKYETLLAEVQQIKAEKNPTFVGRAVNVLFNVPLEDRNGIPLTGNVNNAVVDFTVECVGKNGLTVLQCLPEMKRSSPNYINLEVIGSGTLDITIHQKLVVRDGSSMFATNTLCTVEIDDRVEYTVNHIQTMAISDMFTLYTPNRMAIDN